jgi:type I restriction enzyme M protein
VELWAEAERALKANGVSPAAPVKKAVLSALGERDETTDGCVDSKRRPEADLELRDYENVPLKEDVQKYFRREVLPHVPDA